MLKRKQRRCQEEIKTNVEKKAIQALRTKIFQRLRMKVLRVEESARWDLPSRKEKPQKYTEYTAASMLLIGGQHGKSMHDGLHP